jgi:hypothetical protein
VTDRALRVRVEIDVLEVDGKDLPIMFVPPEWLADQSDPRVAFIRRWLKAMKPAGDNIQVHTV